VYRTHLIRSPGGAVRLRECIWDSRPDADSIIVSDAFSGKRISTFACPRAADGGVWLWSAGTLSPDGRSLVVASTPVEEKDGELWVITADGARVLDRRKTNITRLLVSPSGDLLVGGDSKGELFGYDIASGRLLWRTRVWEISKVTEIDLSPDGRLLLAPAGPDSGNVLALRDPRTGSVLEVLRGTRPTRYSAFSPNGDWVVTLDNSWKLVLFDVASRRVSHQLVY
jgi:WD40 repeat protein